MESAIRPYPGPNILLYLSCLSSQRWHLTYTASKIVSHQSAWCFTSNYYWLSWQLLWPTPSLCWAVLGHSKGHHMGFSCHISWSPWFCFHTTWPSFQSQYVLSFHTAETAYLPLTCSLSYPLSTTAQVLECGVSTEQERAVVEKGRTVTGCIVHPQQGPIARILCPSILWRYVFLFHTHASTDNCLLSL